MLIVVFCHFAKSPKMTVCAVDIKVFVLHKILVVYHVVYT